MSAPGSPDLLAGWADHFDEPFSSDDEDKEQPRPAENESKGEEVVEATPEADEEEEEEEQEEARAHPTFHYDFELPVSQSQAEEDPASEARDAMCDISNKYVESFETKHESNSEPKTDEEKLVKDAEAKSRTKKSVSSRESAVDEARKTLISAIHGDSDQIESLFSTGSGKLLQISKRAMMKAREGLATVQEDSKEVGNSLLISGSGKSVKIKKNTLEKAQNFVEEKVLDKEVKSLFATGSGKTVKISKQAIRKAQKSLLEKEEGNSTSLFSTAGGKSVTINNGAMMKAKTTMMMEFEGKEIMPSSSSSLVSSTKQNAMCSGHKRKRKGFVTPFKKPNQRRKINSVQGLSKQSFLMPSQAHSAPAKVKKVKKVKDLGIQSHLASLDRARLGSLAPTTVQCSPIVMKVNGMNAHRVAFDSHDGKACGFVVKDAAFQDREGSAGWARAWRALRSCREIDVEELATAEWTLNHFRWIVWKLAGMERSLNQKDALTFENVLFELKYRYERELVQASRPFLRKILEKDFTSEAHLVLMLVDYDESSDIFLVSDGWYCVAASFDQGLRKIFQEGKLQPGFKFHVCGASVSRNEGGFSPLDLPENNLFLVKQKNVSTPVMILSQNCTLPAEWDAKLGLQSKSPFFVKRIGSISHHAGTQVPAIRGVLVRRFQTIYVERTPQGQWMNRTQEEEDQERRRFENDIVRVRDEILSEVSSQECASLVEDKLQNDSRTLGPREVKRKVKVLLQQQGSWDFAEVTIWDPPEDFWTTRDEGSLLQFRNLNVVGRSAQYRLPNTVSLVASRKTTSRKIRDRRDFASATFAKRALEPMAEQQHPPYVDVTTIFLWTTTRHSFFGNPETNTIVAVENMFQTATNLELGRVVEFKDLGIVPKDPKTKFISARFVPFTTKLQILHKETTAWGNLQKMQELVRRVVMNKGVVVISETKSTMKLFTTGDSLTAIMLGKKILDIRGGTENVKRLRMGDEIEFSDGFRKQVVTVKAAIPYANLEQVLQHERIESIMPIKDKQEETVANLGRYFGQTQKFMYAIHFVCKEK